MSDVIDVPANMFEDVTGNTTVDDSVQVDALGRPINPPFREHHDTDTLTLYRPEQLDLLPPDRISYADDLITDIRSNDPFMSFLSEHAPVQLTQVIDYDPDGFTVRAMLESTPAQDHHDIQDTYRQVEHLGRDALRSEDTIEELVESLHHYEEALTDGVVEAGSVTGNHLTYDLDTTTGYLLTPEHPLLVMIGAEQTPWDRDPDQWGEESLGHVLDTFYGTASEDRVGDHLHITDQVYDAIDERSRDFLWDFVDDSIVDSDNAPHPHYETLENFEDITEHVPDELRALRDLAENEDLSITTAADEIKVQYVNGTGSALHEHLIADIQNAMRTGKDVSLYRHRGLDTCIGDIQEQFQAYTEGGSVSRYVDDDLYYNAEALYRFCEETELRRDDGRFVSALINNLDADTVRLPDMAGVDYLGEDNDGKHITIEGDAGDNLGAGMTDGRIDVHGSLQFWYTPLYADSDRYEELRDAAVSDDINGGEIYIHGDCYTNGSRSSDAEVYVLKERLLRSDTWKQLTY